MDPYDLREEEEYAFDSDEEITFHKFGNRVNSCLSTERRKSERERIVAWEYLMKQEEEEIRGHKVPRHASKGHEPLA